MDYKEVKKLSKEYDIPEEDILLIALNRYGIILENTTEKRIRFRLKLNTYEDIFYMAVCVNTYDSPFSIQNNKLLLNGECVAQVIDIEKDTCDTTYFRRNKTVMTLNSNARSQCRGCKFCGSYHLDSEDREQLDTPKKLRTYIEKFLKENKMKNLNEIVKITVCTGCFSNEEMLVEHLKMVKEVLAEYGFDKKLGYIGSQIRREESLEKIKNTIGQFSLTITTECFSNRDTLMRNEKSSLDIEQTIKLLDKAKELGFSSNIIYILGIDKLDVLEKNFTKLSKHFNRFPIVQVLQNYLLEQEKYRNEQAKTIEYYLKARKILETIFNDSNLKPRSWENYRSLFYTEYNKKEYKGIRI